MVAVDGSIRDQVSNQSVFFDGNNNNDLYGLARPIFGSEPEEATLDRDSK